MIKKKLCLVLVMGAIAFGGISGCWADSKNESAMSEGTSVVTTESKTYPTEVSRGLNYLITRESSFVFRYQIFNSKGETVRQQTFEGKEPQICVLEGNLLDIKIGYGTGVMEHTYYNVERDLFSDAFFYVVAYNDGRIAYINIPEGEGFENRRLIVRDIFDEEEYFKSFALNLAHTDHPIIGATFFDEGDQLQIRYLTADGNEETQVLNTERHRNKTGDG